MQYLPLFFDIKNKPVLVVGGGAIALRKATLFQKAGAVVSVVAPEILEDLAFTVKSNGGCVFDQDFSADLLEQHQIIVAATNDSAINRMVAEQSKALHKPVNVVDAPELCDFILPSVIDRSPIMIAVSSGGSSPVLTRILRARIESMIPMAYGRLASFTQEKRVVVKDKLSSLMSRRRFWQSILEGPVAELVLSGKDEKAQSLFQRQLDRCEASDDLNMLGEVALVGAGPGDPDLLTFKALRLLQSAEVVLYDRLVNQAIIDLANKEATLLYVGKARSDHAVPQGEINQLLISYAQQGKRVVRLKGGDPFIFGRGGEEIEGLAELNIPFQVVPGVTAAAGCAAYSGIPLTHRDYAQSVRFVTGHLKNDTCNLPWAELIESSQTVVFYMGLMGLPIICQQLIEHGRDENTPIALVQKGTTPDQKVLVGTLSTIVEIVKNNEVVAPTLIIVGEVVSLHEQLQWVIE